LSLEKNGWSLKVRFHRMKGSAFERAVEALSILTGEDGSVDIMSEERVARELLSCEVYKQKQTKRAEVCGDYGRTAAVVDRLSQYLGPISRQGPSNMQKRSAIAASQLLNRSHLIGSSGLRERNEDADEEVQL
jgi:hypothetical protein